MQLRDGNGKRHSLSLQTENYEKACVRYSQGLQELQERIRQIEQQHRPSKWRGDGLITHWELDNENMEPSIENLEKYGRTVQTRADQLSHAEEIRGMSWDDLVEVAEDKE